MSIVIDSSERHPTDATTTELKCNCGNLTVLSHHYGTFMCRLCGHGFTISKYK